MLWFGLGQLAVCPSVAARVLAEYIHPHFKKTGASGVGIRAPAHHRGRHALTIRPQMYLRLSDTNTN